MKQVTIEDIDRVAEGLPYEFKIKILSVKLANTNNYQSLIGYLKDCRQNNLSSSYLRITINVIYYLNKFVNKEFKDITKDDLTTFLDSHRKSEPIDPLHKWIGTYDECLSTFLLLVSNKMICNQNQEIIDTLLRLKDSSNDNNNDNNKIA